MRAIPVLVVACLMLAGPADAQTLAERLAHARQQQASNGQGKVDQSSVPYMLGVLLYTDIEVDFEETPAREVFKYLASTLELNIIGRYMDDRKAGGMGIDPEAPVTLKFDEPVPALAALELVLEQVGDFEPATWQFRRGFVEVGTKDRLSTRSAREVRVYPIDDLIFDAPRFRGAPSLDLADAYRNGYVPYGEGGTGGSVSPGGGGVIGPPGSSPRSGDRADRAEQIVDFIIESVEPEAWVQSGGDWASIKYFDGSLIVRAPDYIHRQIGGYPRPLKPKKAETPPTTGPAN